jgi:hypothetical protein
LMVYSNVGFVALGCAFEGQRGQHGKLVMYSDGRQQRISAEDSVCVTASMIALTDLLQV